MALPYGAVPVRLLVILLVLAIGIGCGGSNAPIGQSTVSPAAQDPIATVGPAFTPIAAASPIGPTPPTMPTRAVPVATPSVKPVAPTPTASTAAVPTPDPTDIPATPAPVAVRSTAAPDVLGLEPPGVIPAPSPLGLDGWINSKPLGVSDFVGKVVLLDFWTYTCVNCVRTLPYLSAWHQKYADQGLLIVGVHTPEFEFEKLHENVVEAVSNLGIEYVVAQDNDRSTWRTYRVEAWPTKYIVDAHGFVRYYRRGEGSYADTELVIRYLLEEMGRDLTHIEPNANPDPVPVAGARATDPEKFLTRELYAGAVRNIDYGGAYILNEEYYESTDVVREYLDPGDRKNHFLFIQGEWLNTPESLDHARQSADFADYIGFRFFANEVNAVLNHTAGESYEFRVTMDGTPVVVAAAGPDIQYDDEGNSFVRVDSPRMYQLVRQADVSSHELLLKPADDRFSLYALTFGAYPLE